MDTQENIDIAEKTIAEETDSNDDMVASTEQINSTVSFKVSESAAPDRGWTKGQKRSVWIIAAVITLLAAVIYFFVGTLNIFGIFK